jgi:Ca2+-binding RTX toxin-like protein
VALAADFTCCSNPCSGTPGDDSIDGINSADEVRALAGDDQIDGLNGADTLHGNRGKAYRSAAT